jgi:putative tryptophan/tyrosine transport system substrate-binding protein
MQRPKHRGKITKKIFFGLALCAMVFALCFSADAQQAKKVPRIGYIGSTSAGVQQEIFRQALRDLGYIEGENIHVERRYIEGQQDKAPSLVAELLELKVDVLVVSTLSTLRAAKQATKTIPVVMMTTNDPVATGIVDSLARPGGNITGVTRLTRDLSGKRLELLKEVVPKLTRVGVLWDAKGPGPTIAFKEYEAAAHLLKIKVHSLELRDLNLDFERAFHAAAKERAGALIPISSSVTTRNMKQIADLAIKNRLPSMNESSDFVEAGGLISYSADDSERSRRAAHYVDRILKGTKPADLPIEQPTKFEFVINLKTAKQIGLTIPQSVLFRADRVIR